MRRLLLAYLLCFYSVAAFAQGKGLPLVVHNDKWMIEHHVQKGETVFLLSRRYHVPPAILTGANNLGYQSALTEGSIVLIPLGAYNYMNHAPQSSGEARAIYYKAGDDDNLSRISRRTGVSQKDIQDLNNMDDNNVSPGQKLKVGWVMYDATQVPSSNDGAITAMEKKPLVTAPKVEVPKAPKITQLDSNAKYKIVLARKDVKQPDGTTLTYLLQDTIWADTLGPVGKMYMQQTNNEQNVSEEKGTVVFYDMPGKIKSTKMFFALSNTLSKGTIVKVYNPGTDKYVFVKVIGPIPDTKQYYNAILAVTGGARRVLGVIEEKAWCELKYVRQ
ncbi:MAG: hypothetical protein BGO70_11330 [Bacteroidetes bacterium 43-93]|nr:LysM peptidoglycan-binding domain-containing protein [Bacteroidota bacterium]OJW95699.1 MAG: hypothetical protein BGO70_11330 [Bacteroidetes bacterium 43-93]